MPRRRRNIVNPHEVTRPDYQPPAVPNAVPDVIRPTESGPVNPHEVTRPDYQAPDRAQTVATEQESDRERERDRDDDYSSGPESGQPRQSQPQGPSADPFFDEEGPIGTRRFVGDIVRNDDGGLTYSGFRPSTPTDIDEFDPGSLGAEAVRQRAVREFDQHTFDRDPLGRPGIVGSEADLYQQQGRVLDQIREYDEATFARDPEGRRPGIVSSQAISPSRFTAFSEAVREQRQETSPTAPLAIIESNQASQDRIDWPRDEDGFRTFDTLPDEFYLDGERITKSALLRSASGGRISFSQSQSGIVTPASEAEKQRVANRLLQAQEQGRLTSTIPAVPTAIPQPVSSPDGSSLATAFQAAGSPGGLITPTDYTTNPQARQDFNKAIPEAAVSLVPGASLVATATASNDPNSPGGALRTPKEQRAINIQAALTAAEVVPPPIAQAGRVLSNVTRIATPANIGRLQALGGYVPSTTPALHVPRITGTTPEVLDASIRLREGLLTRGEGQVVIGGKVYSIAEDRLSQAIRRANPDIPGITYHATPSATGIAQGGPVPVQKKATGALKPPQEQFTFTSPGVAGAKFMEQSAFGGTGDAPGILAYNLPPEAMAFPGPRPGTVKTWRGGYELEYGVRVGDTLPATSPVARAGGPVTGSLYLPEDVAAPSFVQRTQANIGAATDIITGQQRGRIRVEAGEGLSDDAIARGTFGDEAVDRGITPYQNEYVQLSKLDDTALAQRATNEPVAADVLAARRQGDELADNTGRVNRERVTGVDGTRYVYNRAGVLVPERADLPRGELTPEQYTARVPDTRDRERVITEERPPAERVINEERPPAERVITEERPPAERVITEERPPAERVITEERPPAERVITEERPPAERVITEERPPAERVITEERPPAERVITEERPPAERVITEERPPAERVITEERPPAERVITEERPPAERVITEERPPAERVITEERPPAERRGDPPPPERRIITDPPPPERRIITDPPPPERPPPTRRRRDLDLPDSEPPEQQQTAEDGAHPHVAVVHEANIVDLRSGQVREEPLLDTLRVVERGPAGTHGADVDAGSVRVLSRDGQVHAVPDLEGTEGGPGHGGVEEAFSDLSEPETAPVSGGETALAVAPRLSLAERVRQANARVRESAAAGLAYGAGQLGEYEAGKAAARAEQEAKLKAKEEAAKQKAQDKAARAALPLSERVRLASERVKARDKTADSQASTGGDSASSGTAGVPGKKKSVAELLGRALAGGQGAQGGAGAKRTGKGKSASGKKKGRPAKYSDDKRIVMVLQYENAPNQPSAKAASRGAKAWSIFDGKGG